MNGEPMTTLSSFARDMNVVVIGASGGIGAALVGHLTGHPAVAHIAACSRRDLMTKHPKIRHDPIDLEDEDTIVDAARRIGNKLGALDLVIVATGVLHDGETLRPEKTWSALDAATMERVYRINAVGPALIAKHFLPLLTRDRKSVFAALSARVGSLSDNHLGGWHAYRASKAALNMLIKNFAIELQRRNPKALCVGLHPGTVNTGLSKPFQGNVPEGKLFSPEFVACRLLAVINGLQADDNGKPIAWDGQTIPY